MLSAKEIVELKLLLTKFIRDPRYFPTEADIARAAKEEKLKKLKKPLRKTN